MIICADQVESQFACSAQHELVYALPKRSRLEPREQEDVPIVARMIVLEREVSE